MDISANISEIKARIPGHVTLVAVSKTQSAEALQAALDAGLRVFGENRVQEARTHWDDFRPAYPDLELRLIGHLQTNKVKDAVRLFDTIETVDSVKLADALAAEMKKQGRSLTFLVQVNIGEEAQKDGVMPGDAAALVAHCRAIGLNIAGLMCIPPAQGDPGPHFTRLAGMAKALGLSTLSMGMSGDFETAIAHGATHVRIGSLLFGARERKQAV